MAGHEQHGCEDDGEQYMTPWRIEEYLVQYCIADRKVAHDAHAGL